VQTAQQGAWQNLRDAVVAHVGTVMDEALQAFGEGRID
jgi:hypothetical protein